MTASASSFGCQRARAAPRSRFRALAATRAAYWRSRSRRRASRSGVVAASGVALLPGHARSFRVRCGVRGDLLDEAVCQPLRIGDVGARPPAVRRGELEQAPERARCVGVLVGEREAFALSALLLLPRRPVVLGRVLDLAEVAVRGGDGRAALAELDDDRREHVAAAAGREDRPVVAADAVGDGVQRLPVVVLPGGGEHVVDDFARIGREGGRGVGPLCEPDRAEVGEQRFRLRDPDERRRARERHAARREQRLRLLGQTEEVEPLRDQPLALADELGHLRRVAVLVDETPVRARLLERVQVGADDVLRDGERERLPVRFPHLGGHLAQLRRLRGAVAALAGDDREAAVFGGRERQRRDDPVPLDRRDQLGHLLLAEIAPRVEALARPDLVERDQGQRRGHCWLPWLSSSSARSLSGIGSVARSKRASAGVRPAVRRVG